MYWKGCNGADFHTFHTLQMTMLRNFDLVVKPITICPAFLYVNFPPGKCAGRAGINTEGTVPASFPGVIRIAVITAHQRRVSEDHADTHTAPAIGRHKSPVFPRKAFF